MRIITRSYLLHTRSYVFKDAPLLVGFYQSEYGKFAAIDPASWDDGVHIDDYCTAALGLNTWLALNGHIVLESRGIVENGYAPYYWIL
jgi:hypothetical protein